MAKNNKHSPSKKDQWDKFCLEYVKDFNRARAYEAAGYKSKTPRQAAHKLMTTNDYVLEKIEELLKGQEKRSTKEADDVVAELVKIGFSNIQDFIGDDNEIQDISKIDRNKAAAVKAVQVDIRHDGGDSDGYTEKVKITLHDKRAALVDLGKHFGIFEQDNRQKNFDMVKVAEIMEELKASRKR